MLDLAAAATLQAGGSTGGDVAPMSAAQQLQPVINNPQTNQANSKAQAETQNLVVCPKSSQFNNLPQFPSRYVSPSLERQQREILKHLNASFANHMQLGANNHQVSANGMLSSGDYPDSTASNLPSELIDDELLNEIISPIVVDAAYERAKELIVKRRKLENELVRQGKQSNLIFFLSCLSLSLFFLASQIKQNQILKTMTASSFVNQLTIIKTLTNLSPASRFYNRYEQTNCGCSAPARYHNHFARK